MIERISIELTNRCAKACRFCYNHSSPGGAAQWSPTEVVSFAGDCARHGVRSVSLGGGEPLEYEGLIDVLGELRGVLYRSLTTNGFLLDEAMTKRLASTGLEKAHVSIHFPERPGEIAMTIEKVNLLEEHGIRAGVNLLVSNQQLPAAALAARRLHEAGISNDRIIYLPMRLANQPTAGQIAQVARQPFQSTTCLKGCSPSPRFVSLDCQKQAAWCSYTKARRSLGNMTHAGLLAALDGLKIKYCGNEHDERI